MASAAGGLSGDRPRKRHFMLNSENFMIKNSFTFRYKTY